MGQVAGGKRRGEGIEQTLGKRGIKSRSVTILGQELDDNQPPCGRLSEYSYQLCCGREYRMLRRYQDRSDLAIERAVVA